MTTTQPLKMSLLLAGLMAFSSGYAADKMSKDDYKAAKDKIEAEYKTAKDACDHELRQIARKSRPHRRNRE